MRSIIIIQIMFLFITATHSQSSMVFDTGTNIEVTGSADICADVVTINGTHSGSGSLCGGPLPVEISIFNAYLRNGVVELRWQTETEVNNYGFEIERKVMKASSFQTNWERIGFVTGSGNSNSPKEYTFTDRTVKSGKLAYRLKPIDNDGTFSYSSEIEVDIIAPKEFSLKQNYPNPFNPQTTISFTLDESGIISLKIYNEIGEEVMRLIDNEYLEVGEYYRREFDGSILASGMYIAKLQSGNKIQMIKMMLVK